MNSNLKNSRIILIAAFSSAAKMKEFVKNIPQHKADQRNLEIHWNACEYIFKRSNDIAKSANCLPDKVGGEPLLKRKLEMEEILLDGSG